MLRIGLEQPWSFDDDPSGAETGTYAGEQIAHDAGAYPRVHVGVEWDFMTSTEEDPIRYSAEWGTLVHSNPAMLISHLAAEESTLNASGSIPIVEHSVAYQANPVLPLAVGATSLIDQWVLPDGALVPTVDTQCATGAPSWMFAPIEEDKEAPETSGVSDGGDGGAFTDLSTSLAVHAEALVSMDICQWDECGAPLYAISHIRERHIDKCARDARESVACKWGQCGSKTMKQNLLKHIRCVHLRMLEVACQHCGAIFSRKDALRRHQSKFGQLCKLRSRRTRSTVRGG
ncbi:uncharacterized protein FIBRA_03018 [Fibroporia radiculosa]|uniref:C2H2-type domain-containing protein n=1 Tax=Fibroporia radiculosa TaxID=599839 RepID=J4GN89_9APHY|nr:uncharacterized protein FIBRA_03018 [Fibroporia radiculosa]CCM00970.1 predicted protein [Fibroporia radiculosa]